MGEKLIKCKACGHEIAKSAKICPGCGKRNKRPLWQTILIVFGVLVLISAIGRSFSSGIEEQAAKELNKIEIQVAQDAEKQYLIAKENGSAIDAYVQAGLVAAAYLQANDAENYKKWKAVEETEAKRAGMSF
jgi:RNA polymerase subunit RPABC4/transcription elongation factor Spt4